MPLLKWKLLNLVSFYGESDGGDVCDYEEGFDQVLIWFGSGEEANQRERKKKMKKTWTNCKRWKRKDGKIWKRKKVNKLWKI